MRNQPQMTESRLLGAGVVMTDPRTFCPCCGRPLVDDGTVRFDAEAGFLIAGGRYASLTGMETAVFEALWGGRPRVQSKEQLLAAITGLRSADEEPEIKIVGVAVCKVRKKLAGLPVEIQTCWGKGYRLTLKEANHD